MEKVLDAAVIGKGAKKGGPEAAQTESEAGHRADFAGNELRKLERAELTIDTSAERLNGNSPGIPAVFPGWPALDRFKRSI